VAVASNKKKFNNYLETVIKNDATGETYKRPLKLDAALFTK